MSAGEWFGAHDAAALAALRAVNIAGFHAEAAIRKLHQAGALIDSAYYVPSSDELFSMYAQLGYAYLHGRIKVRWVMCAETRDALIAKYTNRRVAMPAEISFAALQPEPSPEELLIGVLAVMERNRYWSHPDQLFGIPVRIDPAARRPMFEIETP